MSISNQKWILFNARETSELLSMLSCKDNSIKLLALQMLVNTNKRFNKRDAGSIMFRVDVASDELLHISAVDHHSSIGNIATQTIILHTANGLQTITYTPWAWSYRTTFDSSIDREKFPDQAYALDLIEEVKFIHKHGLGKTEKDLSRYKKREYKRSAKNHYS